MRPPLKDVKTMDEFAEHYVDERDDLAYRKALGRPLTSEEEVRLSEMNAWMEAHFPKRPGLPPEIKKLVDEILAKPEPE